MKNNDERVKSILEKAKVYKAKKKKENYAILTSICAAFIVCLAIAKVPVGKDMRGENNADKILKDENVKKEIILDEKMVAFNNLKEIELKTFKSKEELIEKMKSSKNYYKYRFEGFDMAMDNMVVTNEAVAVDKAESSVTQDSSLVENTSASKEYSETNTQVQGVDESDIVKTNGDFIYYLYDNILRVFDNRNEKLELVKEINYSKENEKEYTRAFELYLTDEHIIVIASSNMIYGVSPLENMAKKIMYDYAYIDGRNSTKILIYDIENYELLREIETEGNYVSSRKVNDDVYLITNKYIYYRNFNEDDVMPIVRDSVVENGAVKELPIDCIKCFPSFEEDTECSYMMITSFDLDNIEEKANVETFIGTGSEIYCSKDNLYVTKIEYRDVYDEKEDRRKTVIRKFAIYDGEVKYVAEGEVKGELVNQFSMDEYDGNFRITTTTGYTWDDTSENNLYVLNEELDVIGKLEGLAKGEKIYSTRFMGDKCYVVTYKTVDPLFVIDLSNPELPTVLGELKIPGYSKYLHPLGDNYLIGFGEDSIEKKYKNYDGTESVTAYATGLKLAIFDITDFENPKELDSVKIGGRGSYSELLYNHKSLLYKADEGLFAFPATLAKEAGYYENGVPKYGETEFEGVLVFDVSVEDGITLRGKISNDETEKFYGNSANRVIYIDDKLYTLFANMIKVNDIKTIEELDKIKFEK